MKKRYIILIISIILATFFLIAFGLYLRFAPRDQDGFPLPISSYFTDGTKETSQELLNEIQTRLAKGENMTAILKSLYPGHIIVVSSSTYNFVPIDHSLEKNNYATDHLHIDANGVYTYEIDSKKMSKKGIDVSEYQGEIDWEAVAGDGVEFAFIRALYRGYSNGHLVEDKYFRKNIEGAKKAGIKSGVYVFSQAITTEEAEEEAIRLAQMLEEEDYNAELPIVFDMERVNYADARANSLSKDKRTSVALAFLKKIEELGYNAMLYHNIEMGAVLLDISKLQDYQMWLANYSTDFYWPYKYKYWQYGTAKVKGIKGEVDMNLMMP